MYLWVVAGVACLFIPGLRRWQYLSLPILILLHLLVAPYTKVEESFNIQAIHDLLQYGVPISNPKLRLKALFDHMTFSGAVPRTFVGALAIAGLSKPITLLHDIDGLSTQTIVRAMLGSLNGVALVTYVRSVRKAYGIQTASWYTLFQASQFHVFFYASRTLPNTFAFCLSTFALASFLPDPYVEHGNINRVTRLRRAFYLLTFAAVIFRSELALLIASYGGYLVLKSGTIDGGIALIRRVILPAVTTAGIASVLISVPIDTYFWQSDRFFLPELTAFWFNIFPKDHQGASAWGTSPWHWYFTSAIPRLISFPTLLLIPYGLVFTPQRVSILDSLIPALGYTAVYSILPHKETRFLFPIIPALTLSTALPASYLSFRRDQTSKLFTILLIFSTLFTGFISHIILLPLSAQSYPGGAALQALHAYHNSTNLSKDSTNRHVHVHLTNLALQSGVTRFLEQPPSASIWTYDKSPTANTTDIKFWSQFDYVVVEPSHGNPNTGLDRKKWTTIASIPSFPRSTPRLLKPGSSSGCLILPCKRNGTTQQQRDGLHGLLQAMYGTPVARIYDVIHDVAREGYGTGRSLTNGYWIDWGLEERLVILEQRRGSAAANKKEHKGWHGPKPHVETWM